MTTEGEIVLTARSHRTRKPIARKREQGSHDLSPRPYRPARRVKTKTEPGGQGAAGGREEGAKRSEAGRGEGQGGLIMSAQLFHPSSRGADATKQSSETSEAS